MNDKQVQDCVSIAVYLEQRVKQQYMASFDF